VDPNAAVSSTSSPVLCIVANRITGYHCCCPGPG
jgi:hypothetical protein